MVRDQLIQAVVLSKAPVTTVALAALTGRPASAEAFAAVDLLLMLSPEVSAFSDGWVASVDTRDHRILSALRSYAETHPNKRIFRVSAALEHLPPENQVTEQQLQDLLSRTGEFQLLPNAMIKRKD